jgi:hypothetical protein
VQKSPCLFGLPQLLTADADQPIALVKAPKTDVISTPYFPGFIWMAVDALSCLNAERLAPCEADELSYFLTCRKMVMRLIVGTGSRVSYWRKGSRSPFQPFWKIMQRTTNELLVQT